MRYKVATPEKRRADGITFDSQHEKNFYLFLKEKIGLNNFKRQVTYHIFDAQITQTGKKIQGIKYIADFVLFPGQPNEIVMDVKSCPQLCTQDFKIKQKLFCFKFKKEVLVFYSIKDLDAFLNGQTLENQINNIVKKELN